MLLGFGEGKKKRSHQDVASFAMQLHQKCSFLLTRIGASWCDVASEERVRFCSDGPTVKKIGDGCLSGKLALWL